MCHGPRWVCRLPAPGLLPATQDSAYGPLQSGLSWPNAQAPPALLRLCGPAMGTSLPLELPPAWCARWGGCLLWGTVGRRTAPGLGGSSPGLGPGAGAERWSPGHPAEGRQLAAARRPQAVVTFAPGTVTVPAQRLRGGQAPRRASPTAHTASGQSVLPHEEAV